ncbi:DUF6493 family protein [Streptomyces sp. DSM 42041]|uniref:DUF6493 family protein n=1 Tax=Streptomyces hazeniae TaxID=3075538 RepID=A0ABU2NSY3_9ACTN|nr:DUF6493 family protein [Streptomyces sp. DSM 42041]MDT0380101.1 DUF6493 family protein [Streptomyces sp. DSM 42041]
MTAEKLLDAVREGRPVDEVLALLEPLDDAARRACLPELKALRGAMRGDFRQWQRRTALYVAGTGCHSAASGATAWLLSRDFAWTGRGCSDHLVAAMRGREAAWYADVAHRLAGRPSRAEELFPLVAELTRLSGGPPPTSDGFVRGWVRGRSSVRRRDAGDTLTARLRLDPFLTVLVPRLFEAQDAGAVLAQFGWSEPLAALAGEGVLDRAALLDGAVARLLRGDRPGNLRFFRDLLTALAPDDDELAARERDWVWLAADAPAAVADDALRTLRRLWEAGRLAAEPLAEASRGVLFRSERKLVRAQLVLLGKAMSRDPEAVSVLLPVTAEAFGHPDAEVQERALGLAARHWRKADPAARSEVASASALLGPSLRRRAAEQFGGVAAAPEEEPYEELLPPAPEPARAAPAPETVDELVEEVAAASNRGWTPAGVPAFERVLDGLVRHAHRDRTGLAEALRPVWARQPIAREWLQRHSGSWGVADAVAAVIGELSRRDLRKPATGAGHYDAPTAVRAVRVREAAAGILTGGMPMLLAAPDGESGALEPETLLERLRTYRRLGLRPGAADFDQALLRVRPDARWAAPAAELGGRPGRRLAAWLANGGLPAPVGARVDEPERVHWRTKWYTEVSPRRILVRDEGLPTGRGDGFHEVFGRIGAATPSAAGHYGHGAESAAWLGVLPWHREAVAARRLATLAACADSGARTTARDLPALAEAEAAPGDTAGFALHLALAYGLGARHAEDRLAAVDALLVLAARRQLAPETLGGELGTLVGVGAVKGNRLTSAVRSLAETGAYRTAWSVLRPVLPVVLAGEVPHRSAGELLEVAADCAERCRPAGDTVVGLDAVASAGGSSRRVREARRLRDALRPGEPRESGESGEVVAVA